MIPDMFCRLHWTAQIKFLISNTQTRHTSTMLAGWEALLLLKATAPNYSNATYQTDLNRHLVSLR